MKTPSGGWIPLCKALVHELPHNRPFTRLEAMFSLTLDYDQGNPITLSGYAELWKWSCGKVKRFLEDVGTEIIYQEFTGKKQNQRGMIMIQIPERSREENGMIKFIDSKWLNDKANRKRNDDGKKTERSRYATKEPNPKPIKDLSEFFEKLWKSYPKKDGRKSAEKHYHATVKNVDDIDRINFALGNYLTHIETNKVDPKFIKNGSTFFNNWQDWEVTENG